MSNLLSKLVNTPISNEDESPIPSLSSSVKTARPQLGYTRAITIMSFLITASVLVCIYMLMKPTSPMAPKITAMNVVTPVNDTTTIEPATNELDTHSLTAQETADISYEVETFDNSNDDFDDWLEDNMTVESATESPNIVVSQPIITERVNPKQLQQEAANTHQTITSESLDELYADIIKGQVYPSIVKLYAYPDSQKRELVELVKKLTSRLIKVKHIQDALTLSDAAMSKYPTETELIRTKAMVLINQKQYEEAASLMKNFTPSFDEHLGYYNTLAFAEMSLGHFKESIRLYRQLVDQRPQKSSYWISLALAYERSDNLNAAFESYRHALSLVKPSSSNYDYILNKKIATQRKMHV